VFRRGGHATLIKPVHRTSSEATGINAHRDIVGSYTAQDGQDYGFLLHAEHFATIDLPRVGG
jgi:hypothetical protein